MTKMPSRGVPPTLPLLAHKYPPHSLRSFPFLLPPPSPIINSFPVMLSAFPAFPSYDGMFGTPFSAFEGGFPPWDCQEPFFPFHENEPSFLSNKIADSDKPVMSKSGSENSYLNSGYPKSELDPNLDISSPEPPFSISTKQGQFFSPINTPPPPEPVMSNSGSENPNQNPVFSNSGSEEPDHSSPGSDETNQTGLVLDERKRRRMISNRESARRSRMRKKKHLENLRNQVNRLRIGNRELENRLRSITHHGQLVRRENDRFISESAMLRQRLWAIQQLLLVRELQPFSASAWPCNNPITSFNEQS